MKYRWRRSVALLLLTLYAFVLLMPFSTVVYANPTINAPEINPPEVNPPEVNPPDVNPPEVNEPEVNEPEVTPPDSVDNNGGAKEGSNSFSDIFTSDTYKTLKFTLNDVLYGKVKQVVNLYDKSSRGQLTPSGSMGSVYGWVSPVLRGALGLNVDDGWLKKGLDGWNILDTGLNVKGFMDFSKIRQLRQGGEAAASLSSNPFKLLAADAPTTMFPKFVKVGGWVGIGISTLETGAATVKAWDSTDGSKAQADASLDMLSGAGGIAMGAATLAAFTCPPLAVGLAIGGGLAIAAGTIGKYFTNNPGFRKVVTAPIRGIKSATNKVVDGVKSIGKTVSGWFS
ncbi:hypothetical protein C8P63_12076 [Melghirimyces profundicolus]|uniref:Uncharacterized protein n=1 Tax=Melghirimyces profundicolus TaxID=1242148 RepID=A0A2T6BGU2_9BACL|nr:hypothetical protein [Melghirimyces profundicolus]PTX55279.1 hypothetical protein C8P63_12076 [Melghirimyces profundicolus]